MSEYPETSLDKAVSKSISRENFAVEKEAKNAIYHDTDDRKFLRKIIEEED